MTTTRAIFKGKSIRKNEKGFVVEGVTYPTLDAAADSIQ
jgi:hypothetical protein